MLSDRPTTVKNKKGLQISIGAITPYPDAPLLYLFSATKRNPKIAHFRITWELGAFGHTTFGVASYHSKRQTLWCRLSDEYGKTYSVFTNVTPQMLYQAGADSINSMGEKGGFNNLASYGAKLLIDVDTTPKQATQPGAARDGFRLRSAAPTAARELSVVLLRILRSVQEVLI